MGENAIPLIRRSSRRMSQERANDERYLRRLGFLDLVLEPDFFAAFLAGFFLAAVFFAEVFAAFFTAFLGVFFADFF
ncbi:MAG TPA: hypothetical protein VFO86_16320, partial [Terriglobia bacterium]|nr:hypothetical protein [Terriglobia bacterium]